MKRSVVESWLLRRTVACVALAGSFGFSCLSGCSAAPHTRGAGALSPLVVRPVAWNPARAAVGPVRAVADAGDVVAVFGDAGATVLSSGAVVATDGRITDWADAGAIPGADGSARWIVGLDRAGRIYYLRGLSSFEDVSARYGLDGRPARGLAMLDPRRVGFLLDGEIAVADGRRVAHFGPIAFSTLAGGAGRGAAVTNAGVALFDASSLETRTFALPGAARVAIGSDGRLYAATSRALYAATPAGDLALVYDAQKDSIHGLAASGERVWFADGAELGIVDGDRVAETLSAPITADAAIDGSPTGDVWVLAKGALERFARVGAETDLTAAWPRVLSPIFARSCSACHLPNGASGTDLSTAEAWQSERDRIGDRVVVSGTMPPEGHPLADADRAAIRAWVQSAK